MPCAVLAHESTQWLVAAVLLRWKRRGWPGRRRDGTRNHGELGIKTGCVGNWVAGCVWSGGLVRELEADEAEGQIESD